MRKFVIALLAVMMVTGAVYASDKPALEKPVLPVDINVDITENEPNDDCTIADYLTVDDNYMAAIDPAGDEDWFEVFYPAGGEVAFQTHPGDVNDTKLYLYADDCETELAYNDDGGGQGYYSLIEYTIDPNTTYFVKVTGFSGTTQGSYFLTMALADPPPPAPENDTCEGALPLPFGTFEIDNTGAADDYNPGSDGCTGFNAPGLDIVYYIDLVENQQIEVTAESTFDTSLYLVTDCADVENSCVVGADVYGEPEHIIFDAGSNPGRYYVIFDGFSSTGQGVWTVSVPEGVVATQETTFDSLKSMYR